MADSSRTVTIKFNGDIADLVTATLGGEAALKEFNKSAGDTSGLDKASKAADDTGSHFSLLAAGIVAAAPVAGAAILAGVGAGFIGLGALILKNNDQIDSAWQDLTTSVSAEGKDAAGQLAGSFTTALDQLRDTALAAKPQLDQIFGGVKQDVPLVTDGVDNLVNGLLPGLVKGAQNSTAVFNGLDTTLTDVGRSGGQSITILSESASQYEAVLSSLGNIAGTALTTVSHVANDAAAVWANVGPAIDTVVRTLGDDVDHLASGAVPALSSGLGAIASTANIALHALQPFEPLLGLIGGEFTTLALSSRLFGAAGSAIDQLGTKVTGFADKARSMTVDLTNSSAAGAAAGTATEKFGSAITAAGKALPIIGVGVTFLTQAWTALVGSNSAYVAQIEQGTALTGQQNLTLAGNSKVVNELSFGNQTLKNALSSLIPTQESVNAATEQWWNSLSKVQQYQTDATSEQQDYNEAVAQYGTDSPQASKALAVWQGTLAAATNETDNQAAAINQLNTGSAASSSNINALAAQVKILGSASSSASAQTTALQTAVKLLGENGQEAANDAISALWQELNGFEATIKNTTGALFDSTGQLNLYTTKGETARSTFESAASNLAIYNQSLVQQGNSQAFANTQTQAQIDKMAGPLAQQLGITKQQALDLINTYYKTPPSINTQFNAITGAASQAVTALQNQINGLHGAAVQLQANILLTDNGNVPPQSLGGLLGLSGGKAAGGPVAAGRSYLVGEEGMEIFTPSVSGTIIPNGPTDEALSGSSANRSYLTDSVASVSPVSNASASAPSESTSGDVILMLDGEPFAKIARSEINKGNRTLKAKSLAKGTNR